MMKRWLPVIEVDPENSVNEGRRKRLMYVTQEDFYFLTYNWLLTLEALGCVSEKKEFRDVRKLAFLVDFVSDRHLTVAVADSATGAKISATDRKLLANAYSRARDRLPQLNRVLFAAERRGLIALFPNEKDRVVNTYLKLDSLPPGFLQSDLFTSERRNLEILGLHQRRLRTGSLNIFLENIFRQNGVVTWLD